MKAVMAEPVSGNQEKLLEFCNSLEAHGVILEIFKQAPLGQAELAQRIRDAELLIISSFPVSAEAMQEAVGLKYIAVAFTGVDHIDIGFCRQKNILVSNAAGYSTNAVCEQNLLMILALMRNAVTMNRSMLEGCDRQGFLGSEIAGKTVGIVGFGRIGQRMAQIMSFLGARVLVCSRSSLAADYGFTMVPLEQLLHESHIVSLHLPLNNQTRHMISEKEFMLMRSDAVLVNTSRGQVVNEVDLVRALDSRQIAGAAIDVFQSEPPLPLNHPLLKAPNCFLLPHTAYATHEAIDRRLDIVLKNIVSWRQNNPLNIVS